MSSKSASRPATFCRLLALAVAAGGFGSSSTACGPTDQASPDAGPTTRNGFCTDAAASPSGTLAPSSLVFTGVDFGDQSTTDWETIGFDLDGKCTTSTSTNVCAMAGATIPNPYQDDGPGGIDNNFGSQFCAIVDITVGESSCSAGIDSVALVTDAGGAGTLTISERGQVVSFSVTDVHLEMEGEGGTLGMLGGVVSLESAMAAERQLAGSVSTSLCSDTLIGTIETQIAQSVDILSDGSNPAGVPCDGFSFGMTFTTAAPLDGGVPPPTPSPCDDAGEGDGAPVDAPSGG